MPRVCVQYPYSHLSAPMRSLRDPRCQCGWPGEREQDGEVWNAGVEGIGQSQGSPLAAVAGTLAEVTSSREESSDHLLAYQRWLLSPCPSLGGGIRVVRSTSFRVRNYVKCSTAYCFLGELHTLQSLGFPDL